MLRKVRKIIVKLRMLYADIRGHHGKKWDYEPGDWYMGRRNKQRKRENYKYYYYCILMYSEKLPG